jgi:hypothetical protein
MPAIGTVDCLACGRNLIVKCNDRGALNLSCPHCDFSAYAKEGTEAKKKLAPRVKLYPEHAAPPASPPAKGASAPEKKEPAKSKYPWER